MRLDPRWGTLALVMACQSRAPTVASGPSTPPVTEPALVSEDAGADPSEAELDSVEPVPIEPAPTEAEPEPEPEPAFEPTWEWALTVAPELAEHSDRSPSPAAYERFTRWFAKGRRTIHLRLGDQCFEVKGSVDQGFSYRETVTTNGNTRTRTGYNLQITEGGITESGPGGTTYERDEKGRWQEVGGFGTGCFDVLVHDSLSKVERGVAYFDAYGYTLTAECRGTMAEAQRCEDGSTRTCERCSGIVLRRHAPNRGWGSAGQISVGAIDSPPVDCTQPCPADEHTPKLEPLGQVLKGRRFFGRGSDDEGVLFLRGKDCRRAASRVRAQWKQARESDAAG